MAYRWSIQQARLTSVVVVRQVDWKCRKVRRATTTVLSWECHKDKCAPFPTMPHRRSSSAVPWSIRQPSMRRIPTNVILYSISNMEWERMRRDGASKGT